MADHNTILGPAIERPELEALLKRALRTPLTDEQLREQQVSFAYGNAPKEETLITKESIRSATRSIRLLKTA